MTGKFLARRAVASVRSVVAESSHSPWGDLGDKRERDFGVTVAWGEVHIK